MLVIEEFSPNRTIKRSLIQFICHFQFKHIIIGKEYKRMRISTGIWYYIVFSILLIAGLLCIIPVAYAKEQSWISTIFTNLSGTLTIGSALSILFKTFKDREDLQTLRRLFRLHDSVDDLGLCQIIPETQSFSYVDFLRNSSEIYILMNDGNRWVGNNSVELEKRFSKATQTTIILISPNSPFLPILADKINVAKDSLAKKINDTMALLQESYNRSTKKGTLKIYGTNLFPTRSLFISENQLIETPYQTAKGRVNIPVFVYRKVENQACLWNFAMQDIKKIQDEAGTEIIFTSDSSDSEKTRQKTGLMEPLVYS